MTRIDEIVAPTRGERPRVGSHRIALVAIAGVLATVTNAVAFMLPPLLPLITTSFIYHSVDAAQLEAMRADPSKATQLGHALQNLDLRRSDYLLDGSHFALARVYAEGYWVTMLFPMLVIVATLIARLRNPHGFKLMVDGVA
jgi:hypothetical protein